MKNYIKRFNSLLIMFGIDFSKSIQSFRGLAVFLGDYKIFRSMLKGIENKFPMGKLYPCLVDRYDQSGSAYGHYFHQDLLIARRIFENSPENHVDIGSRIDGFVAHVASFRNIEVLDIRPLQEKTHNIHFRQADFTGNLSLELLECTDSLSCLHALEHFGLGRYGDVLDVNGYIHGLENLNRVLKKDGKLYFSVPIGPQRIEFNAHRVFSVSYLLEIFESKYQLDSFSYVDDKGDLFENVELTDDNIMNDFGCQYGCGILELTKL